MITIGIDPSAGKNLGWAIMEDGQYQGSGTVVLEGDEQKKLIHLFRSLTELLTGASVVVLERSRGLGQLWVRNRLQETTGIIKLAAALLDIPCVELSPATVNKRVLGNGKIANRKKTIREFINQQLGLKLKTKDQHLADAIITAMGLEDGDWNREPCGV